MNNSVTVNYEPERATGKKIYFPIAFPKGYMFYYFQQSKDRDGATIGLSTSSPNRDLDPRAGFNAVIYDKNGNYTWAKTVYFTLFMLGH